MSIDNTMPANIESVVRAGLKAALNNVRTMHPCEVTIVNADGTVDVDLMVWSTLTSGGAIPLPSLSQLPVLLQGNSQFTVSFPVTVGDEGLVLFAERDITRFVESGNTGEPGSHRRHSLSDGMFLPTPLSVPNRVQTKPGVLLMSNNGTEIEITDGLIRFNGNVEINGLTTANGDIEGTGEIKADGEVTANDATIPVQVSTHGHCYFPGPSTATVSSEPAITPGIPATC